MNEQPGEADARAWQYNIGLAWANGPPMGDPPRIYEPLHEDERVCPHCGTVLKTT